jgi:hypothetical protein
MVGMSLTTRAWEWRKRPPDMEGDCKHKQSWTGDSVWSSSIRAGLTVKQPFIAKRSTLQTLYKGLTWKCRMLPEFRYQQQEVDVKIRRKINSRNTWCYSVQKLNYHHPTAVQNTEDHDIKNKNLNVTVGVKHGPSFKGRVYIISV